MRLQDYEASNDEVMVLESTNVMTIRARYDGDDAITGVSRYIA